MSSLNRISFCSASLLLHRLYPLPIVNGKKLPKVFFTRSENEEEVAVFSVTPCIMVLPVGDLVVATFSVEISDSSDISSQSRVPVDLKAKMKL